ncbi:gp30 domain protein [Burkholderia pseudomallei MSHR7504]|nr:gp30 domain protein [Burkholderia pseudomallei MSHR7504]
MYPNPFDGTGSGSPMAFRSRNRLAAIAALLLPTVGVLCNSRHCSVTFSGGSTKRFSQASVAMVVLSIGAVLSSVPLCSMSIFSAMMGRSAASSSTYAGGGRGGFPGPADTPDSGALPA